MAQTGEGRLIIIALEQGLEPAPDLAPQALLAPWKVQKARFQERRQPFGMGREQLAQSLGTAQNGGQNARLLAGELFQKAARGGLAQLRDALPRAPRVSAGGNGLG